MVHYVNLDTTFPKKSYCKFIMHYSIRIYFNPALYGIKIKIISQKGFLYYIKHAVRIISNVECRSYSNALFSELKILKLFDLVRLLDFCEINFLDIFKPYSNLKGIMQCIIYEPKNIDYLTFQKLTQIFMVDFLYITD